MARERDENSGRYTDAYDNEEFLSAIAESRGVAGTGQVADIVGCSNRQALNRLKELEEDGLVSSKNVGRSLVWQIQE